MASLALVLTACTTTTRTRFEITPGENPPRASAEDREAVKQVLAETASKLRLTDFTSSSIVPETIAFYQQAEKVDPLKVIAWGENGRILVDVIQVPREPGESAIYQRAREMLREGLRNRFGERTAMIGFRELERPAGNAGN